MIESTASIEVVSDLGRVALWIGQPGTSIEFGSMEYLATFSDNLSSLVAAWRADQRFAELGGARRIVADAITGFMREQIRKNGSETAAQAFPEDVLIGRDWLIEIAKLPEGLHIGIETNVKAFIVSLAECFAVAAETLDRPAPVDGD